MGVGRSLSGQHLRMRQPAMSGSIGGGDPAGLVQQVSARLTEQGFAGIGVAVEQVVGQRRQ